MTNEGVKAAQAREHGRAHIEAAISGRIARALFWRAFRREMIGLVLVVVIAELAAWPFMLLTGNVHAWWRTVPTVAYLDACWLTLTATGLGMAVWLLVAAIETLDRVGTGPRRIGGA